MARIQSVSRIYERYLYFVVDCTKEELVAFLAACSPVLCHFLVLQGELVEIFACPFAVKIDARREALESMFVKPFDTFENCADVSACNSAQCDCAEFCKSGNVLFDRLETSGSAYSASGDVVMFFWPVEGKIKER